TAPAVLVRRTATRDYLSAGPWERSCLAGKRGNRFLSHAGYLPKSRRRACSTPGQLGDSWQCREVHPVSGPQSMETPASIACDSKPRRELHPQECEQCHRELLVHA